MPHSSEFDFQAQFYAPIRKSDLNSQHEFIFPHERSDKPFNTREVLKTVDFVIAEASFPSTGMGIELGWADAAGIPIGIIYRTGQKVSSGLRIIASTQAEYANKQDIILAVSRIIESFESNRLKSSF